jgi:hypothetical protein
MQRINAILYPLFTALDAFGPLEVLAAPKGQFEIGYYSASGGPVTGSSVGGAFATEPLSAIQGGGVLLVPGGFGARARAEDPGFVADRMGPEVARKVAAGLEYRLEPDPAQDPFA